MTNSPSQGPLKIWSEHSNFPLKFGHSEKNTKFEKIFQLHFDATEKRQILSGIF